MNAQVFENVIACVDNMDEAQTARLLKAVLQKKQVIPVMCFIKADYDAMAQANGVESLSNEEWMELDDKILDIKRSKDMSLCDMLKPISMWLSNVVSEVKAKRKDEDFSIGTMCDVRLSRTTDELAYIACPPNASKLTKSAWLKKMTNKCTGINFWLTPPQ
jgi:hypothetical protein